MSITKTPAELKAIIAGWRDDLVSNQVNCKCVALAEQANAALVELVEQAELEEITDTADLDTWFETHFHLAPVSHDTDFYNALYAAKEGLKAQLAA
jgi:hypothetical protein